MTNHLALKPLPNVLRSMGLNVVELDGWLEAQGAYFWTDPAGGDLDYDGPPSGYMVHHTAGATSRPTVKAPGGNWSKANAWIGLSIDGGKTLTQEGAGIPTIVLTSAGPARVSSGYGFKPALWDYTFQDRRGPIHAAGSDGGTAANRYVYNVETTHRGDGSPIDAGVWSHVVGLGVALHTMFRWKDRTIGHTGWTKRKIDPYWSAGWPHDGADCIADVQDAIFALVNDGPTDPAPPIDPDPPTERKKVYLPMEYGMGFAADPDRKMDVEWLQRALLRAGLFNSSHGIDGIYGDDTASAVAKLPGGDPDGRIYDAGDHDALLAMAYNLGDAAGYVPHIHRSDEGIPIE